MHQTVPFQKPGNYQMQNLTEKWALLMQKKSETKLYAWELEPITFDTVIVNLS